MLPHFNIDPNFCFPDLFMTILSIFRWNFPSFFGSFVFLLTWFFTSLNLLLYVLQFLDTKKFLSFRHLLRWLGAFYIKRRIEPESGSKDIIYRAALHTYMVDCLKAGHNIKFYIEGGRTRTGKPLLPKVGLLSVIVDAYMDKTVEDALLVPVSVNYDKLVDGNFIREQLGQPKKKETFSAAISAIWTTINSSHGACRIDFNQPFSLKVFYSAVAFWKIWRCFFFFQILSETCDFIPKQNSANWTAAIFIETWWNDSSYDFIAVFTWDWCCQGGLSAACWGYC